MRVYDVRKWIIVHWLKRVFECRGAWMSLHYKHTSWVLFRKQYPGLQWWLPLFCHTIAKHWLMFCSWFPINLDVSICTPSLICAVNHSWQMHIFLFGPVRFHPVSSYNFSNLPSWLVSSPVLNVPVSPPTLVFSRTLAVKLSIASTRSLIKTFWIQPTLWQLSEEPINYILFLNSILTVNHG